MSGARVGLCDRYLKERLKRNIFLPNCCISRHNKASKNKGSESLCSAVTLKRKEKSDPPHDGGDAQEAQGRGLCLTHALSPTHTAGAPTG